MPLPPINTGHRIGFVGTRFAGTDGVSLEAAKWAKVLWHNRHVSYWFAGKLDTDPEVSHLVPHAYFGHPDIQWINHRVFGKTTRDPEVTRRIFALAEHLKRSLYEFVRKFDIEILCVQNASCIPMNIPLGVAIALFCAETNFPTIAHHHDFYWERDRFAVNSVGDLLRMAFPCTMPCIQHVTINSEGQRALSHRRGASSVLVPNVLDFESPTPEIDDYNADFRQAIGVAPDDILFLQPTRVVPRKGIEHAISLLAALKNPKCKLVVSHESGDEGDEYLHALREMAESQGVDLRYVPNRIGEERDTNATGEKVYLLADAYLHADFITYPSLYEGFGNALIEAFYYRQPVLVNRYSIFVSDIEPKGFDVITMNGYLTKSVVNKVRRVIEDPEHRRAMVDRNFDLGKRFFSYAVLRRKLRALVTNVTGMDDL
ncbi:glycosyltransferase family 4 protein [Botrimarina hoheduenensis]|uniref:Glycosyl transferases group 1 n=1 Tax=Botrimarina hoheduenensis TaxID=2528000 RepID=A0A5C5W8L5_9BACT|nr:glycosyltransferase family 4 protein [Botrimarina hoheduenensis]TWT46807.1 Glycosyl transferases group 1 [Botrimarina hoheduenensis]